MTAVERRKASAPRSGSAPSAAGSEVSARRHTLAGFLRRGEDSVRLSALRLPSFMREDVEGLSYGVKQSSDAKAHRENGGACPPLPACGGGRAKRGSKGPLRDLSGRIVRQLRVVTAIPRPAETAPSCHPLPARGERRPAPSEQQKHCQEEKARTTCRRKNGRGGATPPARSALRLQMINLTAASSLPFAPGCATRRAT